MKRILIIETEYEGHYLTGYIKYILRSFKNQKVSITLLTSVDAEEKASGAIKILKAEKVKFNIETIKYLKITNYSSAQLIINQIKLYFAIKKKFRKINSVVKFDHVIATSIQKFDKSLVFFGTPFQNVSFSGIYLGAKFHLTKFGISYQSRFNYLEKIFFKKLLYIPTLQNIITNDYLLKRYLQSENCNNSDKLHFLHDPKEFNFSFGKSYSRKKLCIPNKCIIILVYGALIDSKGIIELLSIFNNKPDKDIRVILAGKQVGKNQGLSINHNFINQLKMKKKIFSFNDWISEKKEALLFSAADIVWIGYKNYSSPSGVFYQAIHKSIPMLISNNGLINNLNKKIKVGYAVNIYDSLDIIKGIKHLLNKKNKSKFKENILKFSRISESKNWVLGFKKIHHELFY